MPAPRLPIFYINLDSRPDRREFMEAQFARLGITAERVSAVTTAEVPASLVERHADPRNPWPASAGDLACGLSHQLIWRRMAAEGLPSAVILEDDALLADNFVDFLEPGILQRLGADLLKLETYRNRVLLGRVAAMVGNTEMRELQSTQLGSAAYVLSLAVAQSCLADPLADAMSVDRLLFGRGGRHLLHSRVLQAVPSPAVQLDRRDGRPRANATDVAYSDIYAGRRKSLAARRTPRLGVQLSWSIAHATKLVRLIARDPGSLRRSRRRVPFTLDAGATPAD